VHRFAFIGALFGFISSIVGSAGPFVAPFYLSFGLAKSAFIGTEALGTAGMHIVKLLTYQALDVLSCSAWIKGLTLGPVMLAGGFVGKRMIDHIPVPVFIHTVEFIVLGFGLWFLIK
jgi:uncharacterized membrane protein YfcA